MDTGRAPPLEESQHGQVPRDRCSFPGASDWVRQGRKGGFPGISQAHLARPNLQCPRVFCPRSVAVLLLLVFCICFLVACVLYLHITRVQVYVCSCSLPARYLVQVPVCVCLAPAHNLDR